MRAPNHELITDLATDANTAKAALSFFQILMQKNRERNPTAGSVDLISNDKVITQYGKKFKNRWQHFYFKYASTYNLCSVTEA